MGSVRVRFSRKGISVSYRCIHQCRCHSLSEPLVGDTPKSTQFEGADADAFMKSVSFRSLSSLGLGYLNHAEEVAVGIFQDDKIIARFISPWIARRPYLD